MGIDWGTVSAVLTAGGTLVLAVASFGSIRSAERAARSAERALQVSLRPILVGARPTDPQQKLIWTDGHSTHLTGSAGYAHLGEDVIYLGAALRNLGPGLGIVHGWSLREGDTPVDPADFRRQGLDMYVAPSDHGTWHAALRDPADPAFAVLADQVKNRQRINVDLLYGDHEGGQRTIARISLLPRQADDGWVCQTVRHWNLDRPDPRL
ncbi:hypothetical protein DN069_05460 [Streptacidiphilus pinicola]|uniref:Uncharacterized protein n=1 Tax=Streptacidiphilus pinicola TaxID=2219663 RepID=A0A2X0JG41_9ACTN|nr:hypothetical protein [Streptacidiphilus pinicola]RAG86598.1 hypothetical protein DN069_05460 [Streptacidiphilus pinicola]